MNKTIYHEIDETLKELNRILKSSPDLDNIKRLLFKPILNAMTDLDIINGDMEIRDPQSAHANLPVYLDEIIAKITDTSRVKLSAEIEQKLTALAEKISKLTQTLHHHNDTSSSISQLTNK